MVEQRQVPRNDSWRGSRAPEPEPGPTKKKQHGAGLVVAVQSIACVIVLLLALLMRVAGGEAYAQLCRSFQESLMRNDLLATLAALWDGDPMEGAASQLEEDNAHAPAVGESTTASQDSMTTTATAGSTTTTGGDTAGATTGTAGASLPTGVVAVPLRINHIPIPPVVDGTLTSGYGYREDPTGEGVQFHRGVDIAASTGTPIASMFYGTVTAVGESASLGHFVRLSHGDGVEVLYAHCSAVLAQEGAVMRPGETVALVGATGDATGSHVHIQVSAYGQIYDPSRVASVARYV